MEIIIQPSHHQIGPLAANLITKAIQKKPNLTLGLATGSTPIELYKTLVRFHKEDGLDFSKVTTFNLDEYIGLPTKHPQSYHTFMEKHLFDHVNIPSKNRHIPQNTAKDHDSLCVQYEEKIVDAGGIDIQILGIGTDGHIAFNEKGSSLASRTRPVTLSQSTLLANAIHFGGNPNAVPEMAITMGIGTIMEAKQCMLLASGTSKSTAIASAIEGPVTAMIPASILQTHPDTIFLIDEDAALELKEKNYYKRCYENKLKLQAEHT